METLQLAISSPDVRVFVDQLLVAQKLTLSSSSVLNLDVNGLQKKGTFKIAGFGSVSGQVALANIRGPFS